MSKQDRQYVSEVKKEDLKPLPAPFDTADSAPECAPRADRAREQYESDLDGSLTGTAGQAVAQVSNDGVAEVETALNALKPDLSTIVVAAPGSMAGTRSATFFTSEAEDSES